MRSGGHHPRLEVVNKQNWFRFGGGKLLPQVSWAGAGLVLYRINYKHGKRHNKGTYNVGSGAASRMLFALQDLCFRVSGGESIE